MCFAKWSLLVLAITGVVLWAAPGYAIPAELSTLDSKKPSSAGHHGLTKLDHRGDDTPIFLCSWKPFPDSPENHGYDLFGYAKKRVMKDSAHAEWHIDNHGSVIADIGMIPLNQGILRFRK